MHGQGYETSLKLRLSFGKNRNIICGTYIEKIVSTLVLKTDISCPLRRKTMEECFTVIGNIHKAVF